MHRFATILRRARLARGWTLADVAQRAHSHKGYMSGIETGRVNPPSAQLVLKLAQAYDLDGTTLLLHAVVEKAPKEVRVELRRRVFGTKSRGGTRALARREQLRLERLREKVTQVHHLIDELMTQALLR